MVAALPRNDRSVLKLKAGILLDARFSSAYLITLRRFTEQHCDTPQTGDAYQRIDDAAEGGQLTAANKRNAVKGKQPYAAPVQRADDDQNQSDAVNDLHDGPPPFPKKYADM
jgi:hypothetical protein